MTPEAILHSPQRILWTGVETRTDKGAPAPNTYLQALFLCLQRSAMAARCGKPLGLPGSFVSGFLPRTPLSPTLIGGR